MENQFLNVITTAAVILNSAALIYQVYRQFKTRSVSYVQVRNKNSEGVEEFTTVEIKYGSSRTANAISIKSDNTVEITRPNGEIISYSGFVYWRG